MNKTVLSLGVSEESVQSLKNAYQAQVSHRVKERTFHPQDLKAISVRNIGG